MERIPERTPEPSSFLARRRWRKSRRCVNCGGRGVVKIALWNNWECPDCSGFGYYPWGRLWGDDVPVTGV